MQNYAEQIRLKINMREDEKRVIVWGAIIIICIVLFTMFGGCEPQLEKVVNPKAINLPSAWSHFSHTKLPDSSIVMDIYIDNTNNNICYISNDRVSCVSGTRDLKDQDCNDLKKATIRIDEKVQQEKDAQTYKEIKEEMFYPNGFHRGDYRQIDNELNQTVQSRDNKTYGHLPRETNSERQYKEVK